MIYDEPTSRAITTASYFNDILNTCIAASICENCGKKTTELVQGCDSAEGRPMEACMICIRCADDGKHFALRSAPQRAPRAEQRTSRTSARGTQP